MSPSSGLPPPSPSWGRGSVLMVCRWRHHSSFEFGATTLAQKTTQLKKQAVQILTIQNMLKPFNLCRKKVLYPPFLLWACWHQRKLLNSRFSWKKFGGCRNGTRHRIVMSHFCEPLDHHRCAAPSLSFFHVFSFRCTIHSLRASNKSLKRNKLVVDFPIFDVQKPAGILEMLRMLICSYQPVGVSSHSRGAICRNSRIRVDTKKIVAKCFSKKF